MISLKACRDAPIFLPLPRDDLGVKKRVKVLGVTVDRLLGFPEHGLLGVGSDGEDGGFSSPFGLLLVSVSCDEEASDEANCLSAIIKIIIYLSKVTFAMRSQ